MQKEKTNKKFLVIALIVIILIVAIIVGVLLYKKSNNPTNTVNNSDWTDLYFNYVKEISSNMEKISEEEDSQDSETYQLGLPYGVDKESVTAEFIDIFGDNTPELILHCNKKGKQDDKSISIIKKVDNRVDFDDYCAGDEIELLYNIETKTYNYYAHYLNSELLTERYIALSERENEPNYTSVQFNPDKKETEFEEKYIEIETPENKFSIKPNMSDEEIKTELKNAKENYKDKESIITEEVKAITEQKAEEIRQQKEKAQKEAEEKAKAEEEARKKAEEEANKGLKVGNYTLKYGTYVGYETLYDPSGNETVKHTVIINQDGTLTYNGNTSKYTISGNYIKGNSGMPFQVTGDNQFTLEAGGGVKFTYQG